jgi:hypothetical protein
MSFGVHSRNVAQVSAATSDARRRVTGLVRRQVRQDRRLRSRGQHRSGNQ